MPLDGIYGVCTGDSGVVGVVGDAGARILMNDKYPGGNNAIF